MPEVKYYKDRKIRNTDRRGEKIKVIFETDKGKPGEHIYVTPEEYDSNVKKFYIPSKN